MKKIVSKSILNKSKKRDSWFLNDYTINPYSGCSFNCQFCYIRGSKYGTHMEEKMSVKENAVLLLDKQLRLRAAKNQHGVIVLASATEPYLHFEEELKMTRSLLEVILRYRFPVHIITRSTGVLRDLDLLKEIDKTAILPEELKDQTTRGAFITFSFSNVVDSINRLFEPGATPPSQRLEAMKKTAAAGLHTGVSFMPILPYIADGPEDLENAFSLFKAHGAGYVMAAGLTLFGTGPADSKTLMMRVIKNHFPQHLAAYEKLYHYGFQPLPYYRNSLQKKLDVLYIKYAMGSRI